MPAQPLTLKPAHILIALGIVALAFALRVILLVERAQADPAFIPFPTTDQEVYYRFGSAFLDGGWPYRPYANQPGISYFYGVLMGIVGNSVTMLRFGVAAFDAVAVGFLVGAGWLLTRRAWGGYIAGTLMAVYPVSVFYGTSLYIAPLAAWLVVLCLFFILWQRERLAWWRSVALGLLFGYLVVTRANLVLIAPLFVLWLWWQNIGWRRWLAHSALAAGVAVLVLAPFTYWNWYISAGEFHLITTDNSYQLYSGNNRDAAGTGGGSPAFDNNDIAPRDAIWRDIALDPVRYAGLMLRKAAITWDAAEIGDIYKDVQAISPLLQALPLDFRAMALLGLFGLALLWYHDRRLAQFFILILAWMTLGAAISFAISRLRYPFVMLLMLLAAYGLSTSVALLRSKEWRMWPRRLLIPLALIALVTLIFPGWALGGDVPPVPPKRTYATLPTDAIPLEATFGDAVQLLGYRELADWWPAAANGWTTPDRAYTVELFWQVLQPTDADYNFYLAYIHDGTRYMGMDRAIGSISYPPKPTSYWQPGEIHGEIVSILPANAELALPRAQTGRMEVGVYRIEGSRELFDWEIVRVPITAPNPSPALALQTLAIYNTQLPDAPAMPPDALQFGPPDPITLRAYDWPQQVTAGASVPFRFAWQAQADIQRDYNLFLHVMDARNELAAQGDSAPLPDLNTSNWRPDMVFTSEILVTMPQTAGAYDIFMGLIDVQTGQRLPIAAPDYRPRLGRVIVTGD